MAEDKVVEPSAVLVAEAHKETQGWDELLQKHFGEEWERAKRVMICESGGDPNADGDRHLTYWENGELYGFSTGLFQIRHLPGRPDPEWLKDPINNITYAAGMWKSQGWSPWTCKRVLGL